MFFNRKLNRQYHNVISTIKSEGEGWTFSSSVSLEDYEYNPSGVYYSVNSAMPDYRETSELEFDANGVVITYHPYQIASYGLVEFSNYILTQDDKYLMYAATQADHLATQALDNGGYIYYHLSDYTVSGTNVKLADIWPSAISQGAALSLLSKIYVQTGDIKYFDACSLLLEPFCTMLEDGGIRDYFNSHVFYEEYPNAEYPILRMF